MTPVVTRASTERDRDQLENGQAALIEEEVKSRRLWRPLRLQTTALLVRIIMIIMVNGRIIL